MRYAIVSDLHANVQAWTAVLTDILSFGADMVLCLGDVVGYGPAPADVLELAHARVHHFVLGNHDAVLAGKLAPTHFNPDAQRGIEWTYEHLDPRAGQFLGTFPYVLEGPGFRCVHGDPSSPARFRYVIDPDDALRAWQSCPEQLVFLGHTHVPALFVLGASGTPHQLPPQDFALEPGKRYIVNVGSVGQPRDRDLRACYCLYDEESESVVYRRVPFDIDAYRRQLERARLPAAPSCFIRLAEASQPSPLRDTLDFHPPGEADLDGATVTVEQLAGARQAARRWRARTGMALVLAVVGVGAGALAWSRLSPNPEMQVAASIGGAVLSAPGLHRECLQAPEMVPSVNPNARLRCWSVRLQDPRRQTISAGLRQHPADVPGPDVWFRVRSAAPLEFSLTHAPVAAVAGMRFQAGCRLCLLSGHTRGLGLCLVQVHADGTEQVLVHHILDGLEPERWEQRSNTMARRRKGLRMDGSVKWILQGELHGELLIAECSLVCAEQHPAGK